MKYTCTLLLALICCSAVISAQMPGAGIDTVDAPRFLFKGGNRHDFGKISERQYLEYAFPFKNTGKQPLIIRSIYGNGGNERAQWPEEPVPPGKAGIIHVYISTQGSRGPMERIFYIRSNAPYAGGFYELRIKANLISDTSKSGRATGVQNVPEFYFADGEMHDFGTVQEGPVIEYEFRFKNTGRAPLFIHHCSASGGGAFANDWSAAPVPPGKTGFIKVGMYTQGKNGPFQKTIYVQSNVPDGRIRYELYIKGSVIPARASPVSGNDSLLRRN